MNHDRKTVKTAAEPIPEEQGSDDGFEIEIEQFGNLWTKCTTSLSSSDAATLQ